MNYSLRPYQEESLTELRKLTTKHRNILVQLPTGGGKTIIQAMVVTMMLDRAIKLNKAIRIWIVIPRDEIINETSKKFKSFGIVHKTITPGEKESPNIRVSIWSRETLSRRINAGKIKYTPDFIILDEAHLGQDFQEKLKKLYDQSIPTGPGRIIGYTATPERTDNRPLSDIYEALLMGPSIPDLIEQNYLSRFVYLAPSIEHAKFKKSSDGDISEASHEEFLEKNSIFGKTLDLYRKHGLGRPAVVFARSVKSAYDIAERFREAGYKFHAVEGNMATAERKRIFDALRSGEIDGIVSRDLATYGLDIPSIACIIMLRLTLSTPLYFQMIGRGLRIFDGKLNCVIIDQVNNWKIHADKRYPEVCPLYIADYKWNYDGYANEIKEPKEKIPSVTLCYMCGSHYEGNVCPICGPVKSADKTAPRLITEVEVPFRELKNPVPYKDLPYDCEEQKSLQ
jgi:superfamily II DNA or RNA helicase